MGGGAGVDGAAVRGVWRLLVVAAVLVGGVAERSVVRPYEIKKANIICCGYIEDMPQLFQYVVL